MPLSMHVILMNVTVISESKPSLIYVSLDRAPSLVYRFTQSKTTSQVDMPRKSAALHLLS